MPIRMTGLTSGLDTESIVNALMSAQRTKQTKVENKKQKLEWKQEIWKSLNTKIYGFYKDSLSKMKYSSNYTTKKAAVNDSTKMTVTASTKAAAGSYKVEISSIASAQYVTSAKLGTYKDSNGNDKTATSSTKLTDLGMESGSVLKLTVGEKTTGLQIDSNTTISDFVSFCSDAGLNATFDEKQQRFFISSKDSGKENSFSMTAEKLSDNTSYAIDSLRDTIDVSNLTSSQKESLNSITNKWLSNGVSSITSADETNLVDLAKSSANADAESKANAFYTAVANAKYASEQEKADRTELATKYNDITDETEKQKKIDADIEEKKKEYVKNALASEEYKTSINNAIENGVSSDDVTHALGNSLTADEINKYTFADKAKRESDAETNTKQAIQTIKDVMGDSDNDSTSDDDALKKIGLQSFNIDDVPEEGIEETDGSMVLTKASDSVIKYNGATLSSTTTSIEVAGVTLNLLGTTKEGETVNVTVSNDTSAVYDTIKEFITEYNSILKTMNTYYDAASASSYEVLTDEQKEAMSDDEVDKWNTKIKDSLLRRDSTLSGLISVMKTDLMGTVTASNGKTYSLANLGITTSSKNYNEGGLLHIKGDEDDDEFADSTNTLMQMLEDDPDTVKEVLSGLASNLYDSLNKKMATSTLSSALTFYNDKEMASQLSDYKKEISDWESKLSDMEERYYSQFSAMETALAKLQSQQNTLSSYLSN